MWRPRWRSLLLDVALVGACAAGASAFGASVVCGGSMEPALSRGDLVLYRRGPCAPAAGQLVLLGEAGRRYVHRVAATTASGTIVTRGDANAIPDRDATAAAAVRGRVVAVLPSGRLLARLASSSR